MRIQQLEAENQVLLHRTEELEKKINRSKQQGITTNQTDERILNSIVSKSLYLLAEKQTLQVIGETSFSHHTFSMMINKRYFLLLHQFKKKLHHKRKQKTKRLCQ